MQIQSHGDLVIERMVSSLTGCAGMGLFRKQFAVRQIFTQVSKAGSSLKRVLMQELTTKRNVKQTAICVTNPSTEEGSNQSYTETVAFPLKVTRDQERLTGKSSRLAIQICAKRTSNILEFTPLEVFHN